MNEMCWIRGCPKRPVWRITVETLPRDDGLGQTVAGTWDAAEAYTCVTCAEHAPFYPLPQQLEGVNEPTTTRSHK